jgi:hypothetical protein
MEAQAIYVEWEGPFSLNEVRHLNSENDFGIYQIYGAHPVYGSNVLIYIGAASQQTFGKSIFLEGWNYYDNPNGLQIYLGRVLSEGGTSRTEKSTRIDISFRLLIFAHSPAYNSEFINNFHEDRELQSFHVVNWKNYRNLLPEVSGKRWASGFSVAHEPPSLVTSPARSPICN